MFFSRCRQTLTHQSRRTTIANLVRYSAPTSLGSFSLGPAKEGFSVVIFVGGERGYEASFHRGKGPGSAGVLFSCRSE